MQGSNGSPLPIRPPSTDSGPDHATSPPEPLAKLFGFRKVNEVLDRLDCARLLAGQGDTKEPLPRSLYHHPQITCDTCAMQQQSGIGHTCLFASLEVAEPGIIRLPACLRHQIAGEGCEAEGTRLSLEPTPSQSMWEEWLQIGSAPVDWSRWACHIELRGHGGEIKALEVFRDTDRGIKRKRSQSPIKWGAKLESLENGARETYGVDAESSIFRRARLQPSSSYRPHPTSLEPTKSVDNSIALEAPPTPTAASLFNMKPTQSFRPAARYPLTPANPATDNQYGQGQTSMQRPTEFDVDKEEVEKEVEKQQLRVRDAELRLHQIEANLRDAKAHARRAEDELAGRTMERDKAVESKKQGLEQMVGRLRDAEGRTEVLRMEKHNLATELDKLKKVHAEELGREKAKATKLRKQAAEETMRANDLDKQLKIATESDEPMKEMKAMVVRLEGAPQKLEREKETLVGTLSDAARQRDSAVGDTLAVKARLDGLAGELQGTRNMASRLEITRQRQAEEIDLLRASAKKQSAEHDDFVARTTADRATFFSDKRKLTERVAELEAALTTTKRHSAPTGHSADVLRIESELTQVRGQLAQAQKRAEEAQNEAESHAHAVAAAKKMVTDEQAKAASAWATVQKMIAENGRSASEREIRVTQGKKDAEATIRAKGKELEAMRRELLREKALGATFANEQNLLRSDLQIQLENERARNEATAQQLAQFQQTSLKDEAAEQTMKAMSTKAKRALAERDAAVEETVKLRAELDDLRARARTSATAVEHIPTPLSAILEDDASMRDDHDTVISGYGESLVADSTVIGDIDPAYTELGIDAGSLDDAAPKTLASQLKIRDREIHVLRKRIEKVEGLELEIAEKRKLAGKWSRRVDNALLVIKILESKIKELEKERAAKWGNGTNPVFVEMAVSQELARSRKMLSAMRNEVRPKCSCAVGLEDQRLNLADSRDRVEVVLETRSTGQHPLWKGSSGGNDGEEEIGEEGEDDRREADDVAEAEVEAEGQPVG